MAVADAKVRKGDTVWWYDRHRGRTGEWVEAEVVSVGPKYTTVAAKQKYALLCRCYHDGRAADGFGGGFRTVAEHEQAQRFEAVRSGLDEFGIRPEQPRVAEWHWTAERMEALLEFIQGMDTEQSGGE